MTRRRIYTQISSRRDTSCYLATADTTTTDTTSWSSSGESSSRSDTSDNDCLFVEPTWETYAETIRDIMQRDRVLPTAKQATTKEIVQVQDYLLSNKSWLEAPCLLSNDNISSSRDNVRREMKAQEQRFLNATSFSTEQYDYAVRCITYAADFCAKRQTAAPAVVAWHKLKESGMIPRENCVSTYMYVLSLSQQDLQVCLQVATFHDVIYTPNEKTMTLRIKSLIAQGDAAAAEQILAALPDKGASAEWKRLRTMLPIVNHYCLAGDTTSCLRLFRQMRVSDGVHLDAETYALIVGSLARQGCFRIDAKPIDRAGEYGFAATSGPKLFDELASELAEDLLELTEASAKTIFDAFQEGFEGVGGTSTDGGVVSDAAESIPACTNLDGGLLLGRVQVNGTTAVCPESGARLRLFSLNNDQRRHVHDTLLTMAAAQQEEYCEKLKTRSKGAREVKDGAYALQELSNFSEWLQTREGEPYTAFVDGPNVGYFGHGDVHYSQVQMVVDKLERLGERPLVIMPQKYVSPKFWLASLGFMQELTKEALEVMNNLLSSDKMYTVPSGCLDDYYWMLASVANQTDSRLDVSTDDPQGRFPGLRPLLISNDMMRDHRLELLEPRLFRRWKNCHIVNYKIRPFVDNEWEERGVGLAPADFFSREIQGNEVADAGNKCTAWHFPVTEWAEPHRLCIRISQ